MGTDVVVRGSFDLTRAPDEAWNAEMVELVGRQLFRGTDVTVGELRYCLAIADSLGLNPLIGEIYFIPSKSKDGKGPARQPYIGRNGLVNKATERRCYYESDTVHENDRFRYTRKKDGTIELTHSYGSADRGEIVGAYAFLHDETGRRKPAFFYAKLTEYLPTFDADWKMAASPWGNQRSAMIEKCAMIGAGRKRLNLGNVLIDGEIAMYEQQAAIGPRSAAPADVAEFDFSEVTGDEGLAERLRSAAIRAKWSAAKVELVMRGRSDEELEEVLARLEGDAVANPSAGGAAPAASETGGADAPDGGSEGGAGVSGAQDASEGGVEDAVTDAVVVDEEHVRGLELRKARIEDALNDPGILEEDHAQAVEELEAVDRELDAARNPNQPNLFDR